MSGFSAAEMQTASRVVAELCAIFEKRSQQSEYA
jgi:hypothetical protein